jgi:hypothetical protein
MTGCSVVSNVLQLSIGGKTITIEFCNAGPDMATQGICFLDTNQYTSNMQDREKLAQIDQLSEL